MTKYTITRVALLALAGSLAGVSVKAQGQSVRLTVSPDSKLWVEGGSNLHDWSCKASSIDASIDVDEAFVKSTEASPSLLQKVEVKVPVRNLKCGKGKMDDNLYKALKADAAPQISYVLGKFEVEPGASKDAFIVKTVGELTVAGASKTVNMEVKTTRAADGSVRAEGAVPLLMTDFGVKPPKALLGTLKTDNEITVKFDLHVSSAAVAAAAANASSR